MNNKNNIVKDCFLHIPKQSSNGPIQWMEIKDKSNDQILLYIPYTPEFKQSKIKDFEHAIYKNIICLENSFDHKIISLIESIYFKYKDIIETKEMKEIITLNIDIQNHESLTQLYFLNKLSFLGTIQNIDSKHMVVTLFP